MAVRPIRLFGDPVLRTTATPVADFDAELRSLVRDLTDTMLEAPGVGLAAPQIGVELRVFTYNVEGQVGHLVNPRLVFDRSVAQGFRLDLPSGSAERWSPGETREVVLVRLGETSPR